MGRKSTHWIRSIISVFLIAIFLFLIIYFFAPDLSLKFFGIGFRVEDKVSTALEDLLVNQFNVPAESVERYLDTEEGKKVLDSVVQGTKKGVKGVKNVLSDEEIETIKEEIGKNPSQEESV